MGWRIVQEILYHCPDVRYRELRVLVALALDARDSTREGMPGADDVIARSGCRKRQALEAISGLKRRALVETARKPAPGFRAVYRIVPLHNPTNAAMSASDCANTCGHARTRTHAAMSAQTHADSPAPTQSTSHREISLSPAELLAEAVPGAGERETTEALQILAERGARSPTAVLRREIADGGGPALVADARKRLAAANGRPVRPKPLGEQICARCGQSGHTAAECTV